MATKNNKIKDLLARLNALEGTSKSSLEDIGSETATLTEKLINEEMGRVTGKLKQSSTVNALQKINLQLIRLKKEFNLGTVMESVNAMQKEVADSIENSKNDFQTQLMALREELNTSKDESGNVTDEKVKSVLENLYKMRDEFDSKFKESGAKSETGAKSLNEQIKGISERVNVLAGTIDSKIEAGKVKLPKDNKPEIIAEIEEKLKTLRTDIMTRLGGGSINRQIKFNGTDYLTKYTDINYKGTNITYTIANNDTTKMVDVTIVASASGSGIVRLITSTAASIPAGATAGTDYVYLCAGTLTITLPTAVGNTNLYTIKNTGSGTVTIDTTGGQTIDGDATVIMPVQYTSVDIISNSLHWAIT